MARTAEYDGISDSAVLAVVTSSLSKVATFQKSLAENGKDATVKDALRTAVVANMKKAQSAMREIVKRYGGDDNE